MLTSSFENFISGINQTVETNVPFRLEQLIDYISYTKLPRFWGWEGA